MAKDRLIVALDFPTRKQAEDLVQLLGENISCYKVGMELFYREGGDIVHYLKKEQKQVFLDLKLHDIPNTVAQGLCSLLPLRADILNLHAMGGYEMMKTAANHMREEASRRSLPCPKLIAVTMLTSMSEDEYKKIGGRAKIEEQVLRLATLAQEAGLDGVVASPQETKTIRQNCGKDFLIITPGVRLTGANMDDQSRIATPKAAIQSGASMLVIGRPITKAGDPIAAAKNILSEMREII